MYEWKTFAKYYQIDSRSYWKFSKIKGNGFGSYWNLSNKILNENDTPKKWNQQDVFCSFHHFF